jgi:hypothetical protein
MDRPWHKKKKTRRRRRRRQKKETFIIKNTNYKYKHNTFNNIHGFFYQEKERQQTYGKNSFFSGKQEMTKFQLAETWLYC